VGRAWRALVESVGEQLDGRTRLWTLEAGAGTRPLFDLPEDAYIVGVDRDAEALERNQRLDERVVADLAEYRPWAAGFDLITSWYVLDGMPAPAPVLDRFATWTAHGGLVVIGVPNLRSPAGVLRRIARRTKLRRVLTPGSLRRRFEEFGFVPVLQVYFEDAAQAARRRRLKITRGRWKAVQLLVRVCTLGLLDAARTDYVAVFRRED
jgi:SAM-dependent methyltransferase